MNRERQHDGYIYGKQAVYLKCRGEYTKPTHDKIACGRTKHTQVKKEEM